MSVRDGTLAERLEEAHALLARAGLGAARVSAAGQRDEVLAVLVPLAALPRLRELAAELKERGFRYVALELEPPSGAPPPLPEAGP